MNEKTHEIRVNDETYVTVTASNEERVKVIIDALIRYLDGSPKMKVTYVTL